ncbi:MAG: hypothetical protein GC136_02885 [Alphaproteobacteria bacterium]|nr:hypothetical protein [Alphaproteobacteria bacterium]
MGKDQIIKPGRKGQKDLVNWLRKGTQASELARRVDAEIETLAPFLDGFSERLIDATSRSAYYHYRGGKQHLADIFRLQANRVGGLVTSTLTVASFRDFKEAIRGPDTLPVEQMQKRKTRGFMPARHIGDEKYVLAFGQHTSNFPQKSYFSGGFLTIDPAYDFLLEDPNPAARKIMENLRAMATYGNHDWLHQLTPEAVMGSIAEDRNGEHTSIVKAWHNIHFLDDWEQMKHYGDLTYYEAFLHTSHARTFAHLYATRADFRDNVHQTQTDLFIALGEYTHAQRAAGEQELAHKTLHYVGNYLLLSLMRFVPMDHPLMVDALNQIHALDTAPEKAVCISEQDEKTYGREYAKVLELLPIPEGTPATSPEVYKTLKLREVATFYPSIPMLLNEVFCGNSDTSFIQELEKVEIEMMTCLGRDMQRFLEKSADKKGLALFTRDIA